MYILQTCPPSPESGGGYVQMVLMEVYVIMDYG
jgi:hypothetical protein